VIDATRQGNLSRFANHSCDPNCETQKWFVRGLPRMGVFAKRTLRKGEEVCFDYQFERVGTKKQRCHCGSANCRGFLGREPTRRRHLPHLAHRARIDTLPALYARNVLLLLSAEARAAAAAETAAEEADEAARANGDAAHPPPSPSPPPPLPPPPPPPPPPQSPSVAAAHATSQLAAARWREVLLAQQACELAPRAPPPPFVFSQLDRAAAMRRRQVAGMLAGSGVGLSELLRDAEALARSEAERLRASERELRGEGDTFLSDEEVAM
jgi:hypothetical protein